MVWLVVAQPLADAPTNVIGEARLPDGDPLPGSTQRLSLGISGYEGAVAPLSLPVPGSFTYGPVVDAVTKTRTILRREQDGHVTVEAASATMEWTIQAEATGGGRTFLLRLQDIDDGRAGLPLVAKGPLAQAFIRGTELGVVRSRQITFPAFAEVGAKPGSVLGERLTQWLNRAPVPFAVPTAATSERYFAERRHVLSLVYRLTGIRLPALSLGSVVEGGIWNAGGTVIDGRNAILLEFDLTSTGSTRARRLRYETGPMLHEANLSVKGYLAIDALSGLIADGYLRVLHESTGIPDKVPKSIAVITTTRTTF